MDKRYSFLRKCRSVLAIAMYAVRQRIVSPRVICLLIVMTVYIASRLSFVEEAVRITGLRTNPMIFTFITSDVICALIIFSGVVFLYADAPFIDKSQPYVIIRSNRFLWAAGQIIHVIAFSAVYFLALNLITAALLLPHGTLATDGWGKLINTLSLNDLGLGMYFDIPSSTVNLYSPLSAFLMNYLLDIGLATFIGLLTFAINLRLHKMTGPLVCGAVLLTDLMLVNNLDFYYLSPLSLARLDLLDPTGTTFYPSPTYALCFYAISAVILSVIIMLSVRKLPIEIATEA